MTDLPRVLAKIDVAAPCSVPWSSMKGDDQVRLCKQCDQHVFNLESMTVDEISRMIAEKEGKACVRFYRRFDGTLLTKDCAVGLAARMRRRLFKVAIFLAGVISLLTFGMIQLATPAIAGRMCVSPDLQRKLDQKR